MMKGIFLLCVLLSFRPVYAQQMKGEYRLKGVQDAASAFQFTPDGRFEFYFIYGVVDRVAQGTYTRAGDTIQLHSTKEPGKDFLITSQSKRGNRYRIQVSDPNPYLVSNVICIYISQGEEHTVYSDQKGLIEIPLQHVDQIYLMHELYPDIASLIKDGSNANNHFEVALSPSLAQVSFKGIDFFLDGKDLTCLPNYFMPFQQIRYEKN